MTNDRFNRQMRFFGKEGQDKIAASHVVVVGVGGLGSHVVQQLALLGVGRLTLVDSEELAETDLNRFVGARHDDPIPGTSKVDIAVRVIYGINPAIVVEKIEDSLVSEASLSAVASATHLFGCLDGEGARLILNEWCAAYAKPYFDLASDVLPGDPPIYGGRSCVAWEGDGCMVCLGVLDSAEAQEDLAGPNARADRAALYGVRQEALERSGPSVVSLNGVVASLGVTEFMVAITGLRRPNRLMMYNGSAGKVTLSQDQPRADCHYCKGIRGRGNAVDVKRYVREGVGAYLR